MTDHMAWAGRKRGRAKPCRHNVVSGKTRGCVISVDEGGIPMTAQQHDRRGVMLLDEGGTATIGEACARFCNSKRFLLFAPKGAGWWPAQALAAGEVQARRDVGCAPCKAEACACQSRRISPARRRPRPRQATGVPARHRRVGGEPVAAPAASRGEPGVRGGGVAGGRRRSRGRSPPPLGGVSALVVQ